MIFWIVFGLLAGVAAKFIMPGKENMGWIMTILLGVGGAFVGGFLMSFLTGQGMSMGWDLRSFATAVGGAVLLLFIFSKVRK